MKDYKLKQRNLRASHTLGWSRNFIKLIEEKFASGLPVIIPVGQPVTPRIYPTDCTRTVQLFGKGWNDAFVVGSDFFNSKMQLKMQLLPTQVSCHVWITWNLVLHKVSFLFKLSECVNVRVSKSVVNFMETLRAYHIQSLACIQHPPPWLGAR